VFDLLTALGELPVFQISRGDKTRYDDIAEKNRRRSSSIFKIIVIDFVIGFITSCGGGILIAKLFSE